MNIILGKINESEFSLCFIRYHLPMKMMILMMMLSLDLNNLYLVNWCKKWMNIMINNGCVLLTIIVIISLKFGAIEKLWEQETKRTKFHIFRCSTSLISLSWFGSNYTIFYSHFLTTFIPWFLRWKLTESREKKKSFFEWNPKSRR